MDIIAIQKVLVGQSNLNGTALFAFSFTSLKEKPSYQSPFKIGFLRGTSTLRCHFFLHILHLPLKDWWETRLRGKSLCCLWCWSKCWVGDVKYGLFLWMLFCCMLFWWMRFSFKINELLFGCMLFLWMFFCCMLFWWMLFYFKINELLFVCMFFWRMLFWQMLFCCFLLHAFLLHDFLLNALLVLNFFCWILFCWMIFWCMLFVECFFAVCFSDTVFPHKRPGLLFFCRIFNCGYY